MTIQMKNNRFHGCQAGMSTKDPQTNSAAGQPRPPRHAGLWHPHTTATSSVSQPVWATHNSKSMQPWFEVCFNGNNRTLPLHSLRSSSSESVFPSVTSFDLHSLSKQGLGPTKSQELW